MRATLTRWLALTFVGLVMSASTGCRSGGSWTPSWMSWGGNSAEAPANATAATKPSTQLPPSPSATFTPGPGAVAAGTSSGARSNGMVGTGGYPTTAASGTNYGSAPRANVANGGGYNTGPYNTGVAGNSGYGANSPASASPSAYTADRRNSNAASSPYGTPYQAAPTGYGATTTGTAGGNFSPNGRDASNDPIETNPAGGGYSPPNAPTTSYPQIEMGSPVPSPYSNGQLAPQTGNPNMTAAANPGMASAPGGWRPGSTGAMVPSNAMASGNGQSVEGQGEGQATGQPYGPYPGQSVAPVTYQRTAPPQQPSDNGETSEQPDSAPPAEEGAYSPPNTSNYAPPPSSGFGGGSFVPPN